MRTGPREALFAAASAAAASNVPVNTVSLPSAPVTAVALPALIQVSLLPDGRHCICAETVISFAVRGGAFASTLNSPLDASSRPGEYKAGPPHPAVNTPASDVRRDAVDTRALIWCPPAVFGNDTVTLLPAVTATVAATVAPSIR